MRTLNRSDSGKKQFTEKNPFIFQWFTRLSTIVPSKVLILFWQRLIPWHATIVERGLEKGVHKFYATY